MSGGDRAKIGIGVVGCGKISDVYLRNAISTFEILDVVACADLDLERARAKAAQFGVPRACGVEDLLADPAVEVVVDLTIPAAHAAVNLAAIAAGKSVHSEKPLATDRADAGRTLEMARAAGARVGCAPDTFLGGGLQTCRGLIDSGAIGEPVAATAFMLGHGPEGWHPDPEFFYQPGAGPLFDMGPYYLTALIALLGPIRRVGGMARISFPERTIGSEPKRGQTIDVNTPTHVASTLEFAGGPIATMITSFDVWSHGLPRIEIYGSEGSLSVPDPNTFRGPVRLRRAGETEWTEVSLTHGYTENNRGIGVADLAHALRSGRPPRASGELAYHVLDTMQAILDSAREGRHIELASTCDRPAPLPRDLPPGRLDD